MSEPTIQQSLATALAHQQAGEFDPAEAIYRQILARQPDHAETLHLLGLLLGQRGQTDAGIELIRRAIAIDPKPAHFHSNLAQAFAIAGRFDEAIAAARQALVVRPDYPAAMVNLASCLDAVDRTDEAIALFHRALALRPDSPEACGNLGNALRKKHRYKEAITWIRKAIQLRPNHAQFLNNLGSALRLDRQTDAAIAALRQAITLRPGYAEAHNNLGNALRDKGLPQQAIDEFETALRIKSTSEAHNNLGGALEELGRHREAVESYRRAIALAPNYHTAHTNCGVALLRLGDFPQGWTEYEWRLRSEEMIAQMRPFTKPRWDGSELNGRRIILHAEQGFGDTLQFARYAPLVAQRGGRVILYCQPPLVRLMQSLQGVDRIVASDQPLPDYDVHCPLLSLPMLFGTTMQTIPAQVPYVRADENKISYFKSQISHLDGSLRKIGLIWAGRPEQGNDDRRSMSLTALSLLAQIPGIAWISLQKGPPAQQAKRPPAGMNLLDLGDRLLDFSDTAAAMDCLDLIISVDTAPLHLAGALGKSAWAMLSSVPDWRWHLDRADSSWYPTMRLFRQPTAGDWESVVDRIAQELKVRATT